MTGPKPPAPLAGGPLIALGSLAGAAIGFVYGEATPGLLIGLGVGVVAALTLWLIQRRR